MESGKKQNQQVVGEIDPSPPRRMTLNKKHEVSLLADGSTHKTLSVSAHASTTDDDNSAEFDGESSFSNVHVPAEDDKDSLPSWMVERMEPKRWN